MVGEDSAEEEEEEDEDGADVLLGTHISDDEADGRRMAEGCARSGVGNPSGERGQTE